MSTLLERATKQYQDKMAGAKMLSIAVPEWQDESGQTSYLYFKPANTLPLRDFSRFLELANLQTVEAALDILILRALDDKEQPVFQKAQRAELMRKIDPQMILKIMARMGEEEARYSQEEEELGDNQIEIAEKNSCPTPCC